MPLRLLVLIASFCNIHGLLGPRVMFWCGKVNQHVDLPTNTWVTDDDGVSGCLKSDGEISNYCQKIYPGLGVTGVRTAVGRVTISSWCERGNVNCHHKSTRINYHCDGPGYLGPRVMFWCGKVNQHVDLQSDSWVTDSDGVSGCLSGYAQISSYCEKMYPNLDITGVRQAATRATITSWCERRNVNCYYESTRINYHCVVPGPLGPRVMFWCGKVNQHVDLQTDNWVTDDDGVSGCVSSDAAITNYCKRMYPSLSITGARRTGTHATISSWCTRGNNNCNYKSTRINYHCVVDECTFNGEHYKSGESFPSNDACNTCICSGGRVSCTKKLCD